MKNVSRFILLSLVAVLLGWGLYKESHSVAPLSHGPTTRISGPKFIEGTTTDAFMRKNGQMFDIFSLSPLEASERDCKT